MIFNKSKYNKEWDTLLLSELGTFNRGKSKHRPRNAKKLFENGEYPLVQTGDIREANLFISEHITCYNEFGLSQSKLWPKNTLCITIAANIAETALLDYPMCFPDSIVGFNAFEGKTTEEFIHYLFTYIKQAIQNSVQGSIQDNINLGYLSKLKLKTPEFSEQNRITNVLKTLDQKIELNKKINEELEAIAKLIYDYWFVQFDFPDKDGKPYKSSGGAMVLNEELNREIPKGWKIGSLVDIADYTNGLACQKYAPKEDEDWLGVIKIKEMREGFTEKSDVVRRNVPKKIKISDGDILFSWSASLEVMIWTGGAGALNQHIFKVTSEKYPKSFYFFELVNYLNHFKMMADLRKTTMGHITKGHLEQSRIAIPPLEKIEESDKILSPYFKLIVKNDQEIKSLEALRDWLLPMLMNGQVTVAGAGQEMSAAAEPEVEYEPVRKPTNVDYYKRIVLAAEIVWQLHKQPTLGHVKLQKLIYLSQETSKMMLPTNFLQQAAGPYDPRMARSLDKQLKKKKWFAFKEGEFFKYKPLENAGEHQEDFEKFFSEEKENIRFLINAFGKQKTEKVEIVATLYACWKEILENDELATEELLIQKFYDWSEEKSKFAEERLMKAINWMKEQGIVPV